MKNPLISVLILASISGHSRLKFPIISIHPRNCNEITHLIQVIGDVLTKLDVIRGSLPPDDQKRKEFDRLRKELDRKQLQFAQNEFDDNTQAFEKATKELQSINGTLGKTIGDIEKLVTTIESLKRFINAINDIVGIVLPLL